ncbi:uncharacterized protein F4822DRAFT_115465 [Hypoxylon trugodes]|uniref:uncharacterized protein n=1 Tax=Hypoxylon trugodes TaxID=326681 RepID=UPI00219C0CCE|nr:uncharacterized protein F4822DRAFT_115465 [Hypoxylon trugodes]KAI1392101.1 hypothetical protein F4822DRAFT_115465 [Hypoxylon trugodes]
MCWSYILVYVCGHCSENNLPLDEATKVVLPGELDTVTGLLNLEGSICPLRGVPPDENGVRPQVSPLSCTAHCARVPLLRPVDETLSALLAPYVEQSGGYLYSPPVLRQWVCPKHRQYYKVLGSDLEGAHMVKQCEFFDQPADIDANCNVAKTPTGYNPEIDLDINRYPWNFPLDDLEMQELRRQVLEEGEIEEGEVEEA